MILNKPQLYIESSYAFDANYEREFKYLWQSGNNQSVANTLVIRDNETKTATVTLTDAAD